MINLKREELEAGKTHKRPMLDSNVAYVRERSKRIEIASLWVSSVGRASVTIMHQSPPNLDSGGAMVGKKYWHQSWPSAAVAVKKCLKDR